nr:ABC transporter substrate-binding protein [Actinobacillus vicugnae]
MKPFIGKAVKFGVIFTILGLNSTAFSAPSIPKELRNESLVYCTGGLGASFNPQKADIGANMNVVTEQIYDKLFEFDIKSNSLKPALAEHFTISEDGKVITLNLRRKVSFHTTSWFTPTRYFNAEDVVFSLNRIIGYVEELPALDFNEGGRAQFQQNQYYAYQFKANLAHYPYFESVALKNKIKKITAPNNYTVQIHLIEADNSVLAHLASQYAVILSKEYALQLNADENLAQLDLLPIGTGVYQLNDYVANEYIRLKPHSKYWGKKAQIPNMVVDMSTNSAGRIAKYLNRECDVVALPEPSQRSVVHKDEVVENLGANLAFLAFNTQKAKMQDLQFRHKIAQAINRKRIADILFYDAAQVAQNVLPPTLYPIKNYNSYPFSGADLTGKKSEKSDRLQLWVLDENRVYNLHPHKMAELIRADLAKIGIELDIKPVSRAYVAQFAEAGKADYDLILTGWLANNLDPNAFLSPILACRSKNELTNLANWCNPEFDRLLELAKGSELAYVRQLLYRLAQKILEQQLPVLPLVNGNRVLLVNPRIENAQVTPFGQVRLADLKLKYEEK